MQIDFRTEPSRYRHWRLEFDGPIAWLTMDVDPAGGIFPGTELKLNSYDLGVDIELADAATRLRFEHPEVRVVVVRSGKPGVFCAGANIGALAKATHAHKVNFCKFTNETRLAIEDASAHSGQRWLAAVNGPAAGGGYELALACDHIMLVDDRRSAVSLPEVALLGVLPGTGGLTRLTDKRKIRRDRADIFCATEEGQRGRRAVDWHLVDQVVPPSAWDEKVRERALALAGMHPHPNPPPLAGEGVQGQRLRSNSPSQAGGGVSGRRSENNPPPLAGEGRVGVNLPALERRMTADAIEYRHVRVALDRPNRLANITILGPSEVPKSVAEMKTAQFWPLAMARELDDAVLHLRANEPELGIIVFRSEGRRDAVIGADALLDQHRDDWFVREVRLFWQRVLKRIDVTSRSLFALIEPGSCFAGFLAELAFAADRSLMFAGARAGDNRGAPMLCLSAANFGEYPMGNGLSRLATRFLGEKTSLEVAEKVIGTPILAEEAEDLGLVTAIYDEVDWDEEVRLQLEERAGFSPDALTGLEANLRFAGPETMETKIFARLSAWQNWIFQRPNATGDEGALKRYGTGLRPQFDPQRV